MMTPADGCAAFEEGNPASPLRGAASLPPYWALPMPGSGTPLPGYASLATGQESYRGAVGRRKDEAGALRRTGYR